MNSLKPVSQIKPILISRGIWSLSAHPQGPRTAKAYSKSLRSITIIQGSVFNQSNKNDNARKLSMHLKTNKSLNLLDLKIKDCDPNPRLLQILAERFKKLNRLQKLKINTPSDQESCHFLSFIRYLKSLKALQLSFSSPNNLFRMKNLNKIMNSMKNFKHLIRFSLQIFGTYNKNLGDMHFFSESLEKCKHLQTLTLDFKAFHNIPRETFEKLALCLGSLKYLSSLDLNFYYHQDINSTSIDHIFDTFRTCSHLKSLNFTFPYYENIRKQVSSVFQKLIYFRPLRILKLNFPNFRGTLTEDFFKNLSYALRAQSQLQTLSIKIMRTNIEGLWAKHLVEAFKALQNLSKFSFTFLSSKGLSSKTAGDLGEALSKLINLSTLKLKFNGHSFSKEEINKILKGIIALKCLEKIHLNLFSSNLTNFVIDQVKGFFKSSAETQSLNSFLKSSQNNLKLLKLNFALYNFSAQDISSFSENLGFLKQLTTLHLSFDKEKSPQSFQKGLQDIFPSLKQLDKLTYLSLTLYSGSNDDMQSFFDGLKYLKNLKSLKIYVTKLDKFTLETAHQFVEAMENLERLSELIIFLDIEKDFVEEVNLILTGISRIKYLSVLQYDFGRINRLVPQSKIVEICKSMKALKSLISRHQDVIF